MFLDTSDVGLVGDSELGEKILRRKRKNRRKGRKQIKYGRKHREENRWISLSVRDFKLLVFQKLCLEHTEMKSSGFFRVKPF